jgi:23S rRNA (adenine2503-C2)-methyltransferase
MTALVITPEVDTSDPAIFERKTALPTPVLPDGRRELIGLSRDELAAELATLGAPAFRARQLWSWLYVRGATSFEGMTDLSKDFRAKLAEHFAIGRPDAVTRQQSIDGTQKWLLRFLDGQEAECVHIPEDDRGTLCVSSQVGCTLSCKFCNTGTQRLVRNLTPAEIVGQVMTCRDVFNEWPAPSESRKLTNIVMMGMGEPLFNFESVKTALRIVMDPAGLAISRRKITLSTAGVAPMIRRCGEELNVMLAVSLHAVTDELRDVIVPLNRKYKIAELMAACREYPGLSNARRITFEYVMLKGVNDSPAEARQLIRLLAGIPAKVNLIPFNPWPGAPYDGSSDEAIQNFSAVLMKAGYVSPVRTPRGRDIMAACGQLKSASERTKRKSAAASGEAAADSTPAS